MDYIVIILRIFPVGKLCTKTAVKYRPATDADLHYIRAFQVIDIVRLNRNALK